MFFVRKLASRFAAFIRGGNWNNGANAGVFALNLNNAPSNSNTNIGFRCCTSHLYKKNRATNKSLHIHAWNKKAIALTCGDV